MMKRLLMAIGLLVFGTVAEAKNLDERDQSDVLRAEAYMNAISTLKARFIQVNPSGVTEEGEVWLSRPGKLKMLYDPPSPGLIVANGDWLIYHDRELKQTSHIPINSTPAGVLVRAKVSLRSDDVTVAKVERQPGVIFYFLYQPKDPKAGMLVLVFSDEPFALRQWHVIDAQNLKTTVSLFEAKLGMAIPADLFEFRDPKFYDQKQPQ
jgi:outer membrane lipoprotein-sorting protein